MTSSWPTPHSSNADSPADVVAPNVLSKYSMYKSRLALFTANLSRGYVISEFNWNLTPITLAALAALAADAVTQRNLADLRAVQGKGFGGAHGAGHQFR